MSMTAHTTWNTQYSSDPIMAESVKISAHPYPIPFNITDHNPMTSSTPGRVGGKAKNTRRKKMLKTVRKKSRRTKRKSRMYKKYTRKNI